MRRWTNAMAELSDIITFHSYTEPDQTVETILTLKRHDRPIICTEWLRRQVGNTFESILPVFAKYRVGWYHWGLVAGRTQTYMPYGSRPGDPMPAVWQHDVFHKDGKAYDPSELALVSAFNFED